MTEQGVLRGVFHAAARRHVRLKLCPFVAGVLWKTWQGEPPGEPPPQQILAPGGSAGASPSRSGPLNLFATPAVRGWVDIPIGRTHPEGYGFFTCREGFSKELPMPLGRH